MYMCIYVCIFFFLFVCFFLFCFVFVCVFSFASTLTDRLGPEILTVLEIKEQVLHRVRLHVKVPGWSLNLKALLTKKLPKFFSRLNEMSGGRENMCLASGSLRRILKLFRMTFLIARFCGW